MKYTVEDIKQCQNIDYLFQKFLNDNGLVATIDGDELHLTQDSHCDCDHRYIVAIIPLTLESEVN